MAKLNPMFLVRLNNRGDGRIEAIISLPSSFRAVTLIKVLHYGRLRKNSVHVGMVDLPDFLAFLGGPEKLVAAAENLRNTIPPPGQPTDTIGRQIAIQRLATLYAEATCRPERTG